MNNHINFRNTKEMKRILLILIIGVGTLVSSCGDKGGASIADLIASGDLESIRAKKKELSEQQKMLGNDISQLDEAINAASGNKNLPLVTTFEAKTERFEHFIELQGNVDTKQNVLIFPEVAGLLKSVVVKEGQKVSKGQLLAIIDDGGMKSQLSQLETQLALSKTTFERREKLWGQKIGSEIQYLQSKTNYEAQHKSVNQLKSQLAKFNIKAPFSGVIDDVIKDQGNYVAPGGPGSEIFRIVNLSKMYVETLVPETYISSITVGKDVEVYFPVLDNTVKSTVRQTGNFINPNNRSFTVEVSVPNVGGLVKPNMTAKVFINDYINEEVILIPQSIISENSEGDQYVFVATKGKKNVTRVKKGIITTGKTKGDLVEVLSGLSNGDNLIEEGARSVKDGQEVKILTK